MDNTKMPDRFITDIHGFVFRSLSRSFSEETFKNAGFSVEGELGNITSEGRADERSIYELILPAQSAVVYRKGSLLKRVQGPIVAQVTLKLPPDLDGSNYEEAINASDPQVRLLKEGD